MSDSTTVPNGEIEVDTAIADPAKAVRRQPDLKSGGKGDDVPFSRKVAKEIDRRASALMRKSEDRLSRQFSQDRADLEAKLQREMRDLRDENAKLKAQSDMQGSDAAHEAEMTALTDKLEAALEAGNSKEVARLNTLISRKEAQHIAKTTGITESKRVAERREGREEEREERPAKQRGSQKAQEFIKATEWWDDPEFAAERGAANAIHDQLVKDGSDPESDAHYRRLNKRLKAKFPTLKLTDPDELGFTAIDYEDDDGEEDEDQQPTARRSPVVNFQDRGGTGSRQRGVKIEADDIKMMISMKLDPHNDAHAAYFAKVKGERLAQSR